MGLELVKRLMWRRMRGIERVMRFSSASSSRGGGWLGDHLNSPQSGPAVDMSMDRRMRVAMFRSTQCGWLELDVILGRWAAENLRRIGKDEVLLTQYEALLNSSGPDVYRWTTRLEDPPEPLSEIVDNIRAFTFDKNRK